MFAHQTKKHPQISKETQDLLKLMMKEAKLTNLQQRNLDKQMKSTGQLPTGRNIPKTYTSNRSKASTSDFGEKPISRQAKSLNDFNSSISGYQLRRKEAIERSGAYKVDKYRGKPIPRSNDIKKEELSNLMAYGIKTIPKKDENVDFDELVKVPKMTPYQKLSNRFEELQFELEDRGEYLRDISGTAMFKQESATINTQIAFIKKEMTEIDQQMREIEDA